jgi:hypothetical protein
MKKFFKSAAILACGFGLMMTATSCHNEADTVVTETVDVDAASPKVLIVAVNQSGATVKYGTKTLTAGAGNVYTLEGAAAKGKLTITKAGYLDQTVDVDFGSRNVVTLDIALVSAPVYTTPADAANNDVSNTGGNQNESDGVVATLGTTSGVTVTSGDDSEGYSIVVFTPSNANSDVPSEGDVYNSGSSQGYVAPYALNCTPNGVTFSGEGIPVTVKMPEAEDGLEFAVVDEDGKPANNVKFANNVLSANLPHFSIWSIILNAKVTNVESSNVTLKSGSLVAGKNNVTYNKYVGFDSSLNKKSILYKFLKALLGVTARQISAKTTIDSPTTGSYVLNQEEVVYTFVSGNKTFKATTYGKVSADVTYDSADSGSEEPTIVHSGGSNE